VNAPLEIASSQFLTFRVGAQSYALPSAAVAEVIRVPAIVRVPQAPGALLGVANLRGAVLPIVGVRELLGQSDATPATSTMAIVLDIGAPAAIVVDSVEALDTVDMARIEARDKELSAAGGEKLLGAFRIERDHTVAKILDIKALLEAAFANRARAERKVRTTRAESTAPLQPSKATEALVTFEVAGQEFALPLAFVREILPAFPVMSTAHDDAVVLGVASVRNALLPMMSLRGLLGFAAKAQPGERDKVIVANLAGVQVGLVADEARSVLKADVDYIDPLPPVLAARTGGESRIKSIYRGDGGRRLISILSPELLFREDVMRRLGTEGREQQRGSVQSAAEFGEERVFLVFRLGGDEYGLPIEAVVEVAELPSQITRLPKTPKFLEGIVNLRGEVLPVIDQRRRFDLPPADRLDLRRLIVVKTQKHRAGLIVDGVSDVLRSPANDVAPPPDLTDATTRLVRGVINLADAERMVLILDPAEILSQAERGLLERFQAASQKANV
jgi:purine-binding chemotaxis protein CheW